MTNINPPSSVSIVDEKARNHKLKTIFTISQVVFVLILLIIWLTSPSLREQKDLWVLFLYAIPSNFLIAVVPFDPIILFFGQFHAPLIVTLVSVGGTLVTEVINYSVIKYIIGMKFFNNFREKKYVTKSIDYFNKYPFLVLLVVTFTPIPFYPFRFLVVLAHYPLAKYLLAIIIGRFPRIYLIALFGFILNVPDKIFALLFVVFTIALYIPFIASLKKKKQTKRKLQQ